VQWARLGSNQQPLVCETSALPLSYSPVGRADPGQGVEPRSPRSERGVLPVRRSRSGGPRRPPSSSAGEAEVDAAALPSPRRTSCLARRAPSDVVHATRLPFDPGSPAAGCAARGGRRPSWRGVGARASGRRAKNRTLKQTRIASVDFRRTCEGLSLSGGASIRSRLCQAEHHLVERRMSGHEKGDPVGRPRLTGSAARELARAPASEGGDVGRPAGGVMAVPAGRVEKLRGRE
jgi:hypothetical protein